MKKVLVVGTYDGVGATWMLENLAAEIATRGEHPLLVDLDPACKLTLRLMTQQRAETLWNIGRSLGALFTTDDPEQALPQVDVLDWPPNALVSLIVGDPLVRAFDGSTASVRKLVAMLSRASIAGNKRLSLIDAPSLWAAQVLPLVDHYLIVTDDSALSRRALGVWFSDASPGAMAKFAGYVHVHREPRLFAKLQTQRLDEMVSRRLPKEGATPETWCLGTLRVYPSLVELARPLQKPATRLTPADGATGSLSAAVAASQREFDQLRLELNERLTLDLRPF